MILNRARKLLRSAPVVMGVLLAIFSAGCVQSDKPLLGDAKPLMGKSFEAHFFENFVDGKASAVHTASYRWIDQHYVLVQGSDNRVSSFTSHALYGENYVVEGAVKETAGLNYWVARKMVDGVFLIVPVEEADSDEVTRAAACTGRKAEGFCFVEEKAELIKLAKATASKAMRNPTLGVLVLRRDGA